MKPGGIRKLVISADKGFGANGMPPKIPPGATLIYEIEMLGFEPSGSAEGSAEGTTPPRPRRKAPTDHTKLSDGSDPAGTDSGLLQLGSTGVMYRDITVGDGQVCPRWATVVVDYSGWLTTGGRPFDSSWKNNIPYTVPLSGVIKGWQEGVPGMRVGGVRKLVIPPALGYGSKGNRGIPGEATLVFEIELLGIK
jgi:FKBP-type peptidyl-prolyl cis-trans isomerase